MSRTHRHNAFFSVFNNNNNNNLLQRVINSLEEFNVANLSPREIKCCMILFTQVNLSARKTRYTVFIIIKCSRTRWKAVKFVLFAVFLCIYVCIHDELIQAPERP